MLPAGYYIRTAWLWLAVQVAYPLICFLCWIGSACLWTAKRLSKHR